MLDVSVDREDSSKALAYLDGQDARVFEILLEKLGSEERVHNAMLLMGLLRKLRATNSSLRSRIERTKNLFPEFTGVTYEGFERILLDVDTSYIV